MSTSIFEFRERLAAAAPPSAEFGFQGLRAADSIAVESSLPLSFIVACDWGIDGPKWNSRLKYFAVEKDTGKRIVWTHTSIVEAYKGEWGTKIQAHLTSGETPRIVIPYRSTEFLEQLASESDGRISILANPLALKTRLDDKVAFRQEAEERGIAVAPGETIAIGDLSADLIQKWGPKIILNEQIGSSGNQTHLIETSDELSTLKKLLIEKSGEDTPIIVCRFLSGPALGAAAIVFRGRTRMSYPSVMITGLPGSSMHRFDYAGSDYGAYHRLSDSAREKIRAHTLTFGKWASELGYKGLFGVDFVVHNGEPYALELNPRLLGTSQLMTELELHENPGPPTISWHLAELLGAGVQDDETKPELERIGTSSLHGFQLLLRNTRPHRVRIQSAVKPGIYTLPGETPVFIRDGDRIADLEGPEEILVTCSPPESGTVVEPRGAFFKLEGLGRLLDDNGESVTPMTTQMVNSFTVALQLTANVQGD
ncbi:MAG: ATP-grasp domain-containing protein, partial [Nitrospinaceae bacterium]|nr:ATP-grasp domain-containing protein [Nitrospinaceae bacterium]